MDDTLPEALALDLDGSFERLVLTHQDRLYSIALRILGDRSDAEEVAQDALVRAYRALCEYDHGRIRALRLRPWLATIVVNLSRNRRRRHVPPIVALDLPAAHADDDHGQPPPQLRARDAREIPHDAALRREAAERWAALLSALPERLRVPLVLRHVDGLSYEEMATALGRPEGTLKAQVHRGLAQLRAAAEAAAVLDREVMTA